MLADTRQLDIMREAAFGLGMGFAEAAKVETDLDRRLQLFDAFHRSFASVRLSIALALRLRREAHLPARNEREEAERDEAPERGDGPFEERDRDRETERASLPLLLRTLDRVADDAQALTPQAAELPSLREVLDRFRTRPAAETAPAASRPPTNDLRSRLAGSAATLTLPKPRNVGLPLRRATGPP